METTLIILDNSAWNRNGDYFPNRFDAQKDAAVLVFESRIRSNIENCVGLLMMAGTNPKLLVTPTSERSKFETSLFGPEANLAGQPNALEAIQIAQLALKHRSNKNQCQRILLFVGSPLDSFCSIEDFAQLGRKLKKNGIAVDVVLFGEIEASRPLLTAFIDAVNNNGNSHLVTVETPKGIREAVASSEIIRSGSSAMDTDMGVDAEADPELAEAIRLSLEEHRRNSPTAETTQNHENDNNPSEQHENMEVSDEQDDELMQAIAMSLEGSNSVQNNQNDSSAKGK